MKPIISALVFGACLLTPHMALAQTQPASPPAGPQLLMVYVHVIDTERSLRFYREVFGLNTVEPFGGESVLVLSDGLQRIVLRQVAEPRPTSTFTLMVPDIDAVMERVVQAGGQIVTPARGSTNRPGVRLGWISDPDGASIELIQPPAARQANGATHNRRQTSFSHTSFLVNKPRAALEIDGALDPENLTQIDSGAAIDKFTPKN